ncbi:MAG TPA: hypothetical protein VJV79_26850 [Polyangiaceae bacterium]|nr:hypothetical protein [Polyangiaceae bacterium]
MSKLKSSACIDAPVHAVGAESDFASLEDYVEHGSPVPGRARDLPLALAGC